MSFCNIRCNFRGLCPQIDPKKSSVILEKLSFWVWVWLHFWLAVDPSREVRQVGNFRLVGSRCPHRSWGWVGGVPSKNYTEVTLGIVLLPTKTYKDVTNG